MSLFIQYPALLGLLALAALPAIVHLLSRARPPEKRFSSIEFLKRISRKSARVRRPKDRLLLLVRTLAVAALAFAFTIPFLISKHSQLPGETVTVVLLIDRSASMSTRSGGASRFETACAEAIEFLEEARPDAANIVWIDSQPDAEFPEPSPNIQFLKSTLQQAEPRHESGALTPAFDLAIRQLTDAKGRLELVLLSDFQASAWKNFEPSLPEDVVLHTRNVSTDTPANTAVSQILTQPTTPIVGQELTILARIRNHSPDFVRSQCTLDAGGALQSKSIGLSPWGEAECLFTMVPTTAGPLPITVRNEKDSFPADNARHAVVDIHSALRLSIDAPADSAQQTVLRKLSSAIAWLEATQPGSRSAAVDIRFINAWDGDNPGQWLDAAGRATTIIIQPAATCPPDAFQTLTPTPLDVVLETSEEGWKIIPEESHPAMRLFENGDFGNPFHGRFHQRLRLPKSIENASVIARYQDEVPAIVEFPTDNAPVILWNLPLDDAETDWTTHSNFLPAFAEIILRTRPQSRIEANFSRPGSQITWSSSDPSHIGSVTLLGSDQSKIPLEESKDANGYIWTTAETAPIGMNRWQISGQTIHYSPVNFPATESDLRPLDQIPDFAKTGSASTSLAKQAALSRGLPIWHWLIAIAILFLIIESAILLTTKSPASAS